MRKLLFALVIVAFSLSGCKKELTEAPHSISAEFFYNTAAEVEAGLGAVYPPLKAAFNSVYMVMMEACSDFFYARDAMKEISEFNGLNTENSLASERIWNSFYLSIRNANLIILKVPDGKILSDEKKNAYIGEAKFLRGLAYFHLVRTWGGLPIHIETNMDEVDVPRSTVEQVYELIINDLEFAAANLPDNAPLPGKPSKWTAKTVLADVNFYLADYDKARSLAAEVIAASKYSLVGVSVADDFQKLYGPELVTTPEEIFYIKMERQFAWGYNRYLTGDNGFLSVPGYYLISFDSQLKKFLSWDPNDLRRQFDVYYDTRVLPNKWLSKKFIDPTQPAGRNDYPLYRYADLLLIYAEADCEANGAPTADGMEKLNMVKRRAYGYPATSPSPVDFVLADYTKDSFIELVIKERGYETHAEGKRWLDLKRTGRAAEYIMEAYGKVVTEKHLLWPMPTSELFYNKAIDPVADQNPGY